MTRRERRRGSAVLEFTLAGIPFIFIWISVAQMAIGMWRYHTIQYAVKTAGAYLTLHGADCSMGSNTCGIQIKDAAKLLASTAVGIDPTAMTVTFNAIDVDHTTVKSTVTCRLDACETNTTAWPPVNYNYPGNDVEIKTEYQFQSALAMFAPGPGAGAVQFGTIWFPGFTHQTILF